MNIALPVGNGRSLQSIEDIRHSTLVSVSCVEEGALQLNRPQEKVLGAWPTNVLAASSACETGSTLPRVDHDNAGALEVQNVACCHGQAVDKRCRGDQRVDLVAPIGNMQMRATRRDLVVDRQDGP